MRVIISKVWIDIFDREMDGGQRERERERAKKKNWNSHLAFDKPLNLQLNLFNKPTRDDNCVFSI